MPGPHHEYGQKNPRGGFGASVLFRGDEINSRKSSLSNCVCKHYKQQHVSTVVESMLARWCLYVAEHATVPEYRLYILTELLDC